MSTPRAERRTLARLSVIAGSAATFAASWVGVVRVDSVAPEAAAAPPAQPGAARAALGAQTPPLPSTPTPTRIASTSTPTPAAAAPATSTPVAAPAALSATAIATATVAPPTPAATTLAPVITPTPAPAPVQRATTRRSRAS